MHAHRAAIEAVRRKPEHLEREHREHAGHQVEQQPADKREGERDAERDVDVAVVASVLRGQRRSGTGYRRTRDDATRERHIDARGRLRAEAFARGEHAGHARELAHALARYRQDQFQHRAVAGERLRRARLDLTFGKREEPDLTRIAAFRVRGQRKFDLGTLPDRSDGPSGERARQQRTRAGNGLAPLRVRRRLRRHR